MIDVHTHLYPEEVWQNPREWGEPRGEAHWCNCVAPTDMATIQGWATVETLLDDMDAAGVEKVVLLGWYWERQDTCEEQNKWYSRWMRQHPDRIAAFAAVNATAGQEALDAVDRAAQEGFLGIGECLPQVQGHTLRDLCWTRIMEKAIEHGLPINLHVTEPAGHDYRGKVDTPLDDYVWLAGQYPQAQLILAHWGGLLPLFEMNPTVRKKMVNVYYDTAASPLLYDKSVFRTVLDGIGPERILYGSDYPLRLYPSRQKTPEMHFFLDEIRSAGLTQDELDAILYNNARKLFG